MAYLTGTAASPGTFIKMLHDELTGNADLVGAGLAWELAWGNAFTNAETQDNTAVYRGKGSGGDTIYIGLRSRFEPGQGIFQIIMRGFQGIDSQATNWDQHLNGSDECGISIEEGVGLTYHIALSSRRFTGVVLFGAYQQSFYCGFMLPLALPGDLPYPLAVGASCRFDSYPDQKYTESRRTYMCDFWMSATEQFRYMNADGAWVKVRANTSDTGLSSSSYHCFYPFFTGWIRELSDNFGVYPLAMPESTSNSTPLLNVYDDASHIGSPIMLEKAYLSVKPDTNKDARVCFAMLDGWSMPYGSVQAGDLVADENTVQHLVVQCVGFPTHKAAMELR